MPDAATVAKESEALLERLPRLDANELEQLVEHHNARYWDDNDPEIDDVAFDKLVEALRRARPESTVLDDLGGKDPTMGSDRRFPPVEHGERMLSLDKCYDDETLGKWREKVRGPVSVTPKIDGVACAIRYDAGGKLELAATRGNGKVGENVTQNARGIVDLPPRLDADKLSGAVEVRGEVYMTLSNFRDNWADVAPNPRNLTAGALRQKEASESARYGLTFFAYDLLGTEFPSEREKNEYLHGLGFSLPEILYVEEGGDLAAAFRHYADKRDALDYEIDGVVMKADRVDERERLGMTAHHPRWAIAYKLQGEGAQTRLVDVEWSVGRSGVITPVAIVDGVFISGVTVTRASLHNAGYMEKKGIKRGALVEVVRRGGVIPHVERVLSADGDDVRRPTTCPSCSRAVRNDGDFVYCGHPADCPEVMRGRVTHFVRIIDVVGFGKKYLAALIERGLIAEPADLYKLTKDDLLSLERMGDVLADKLLRELDGKRKLALPVFLTALGIDEVGPTVSETIAEQWPTLAQVRAVDHDDLAAVHGIGESIADSFVTAMKERREEIDHLLLQVDVVAEEKTAAPEGHPLGGKSVVFTGKLAKMDRKSAQKRVRELGGKTPSGVSAELDYLVIGDDGSPLLGDGKKSTKHKKADSLVAKGAEIEIISESAFAELLEA
jgi:DNA ligase (NAD+)